MDGPGRVPERLDLPAGPEARAVFLLVPTLVDATSVPQGRLPPGLGDTLLAVFWGEDHADGPAKHLGLRPAEQAVRALVPTGHQAVGVHRDDGVVDRALQHRFEDAFPRRRCRFGPTILLRQLSLEGDVHRFAMGHAANMQRPAKESTNNTIPRSQRREAPAG